MLFKKDYDLYDKISSLRQKLDDTENYLKKRINRLEKENYNFKLQFFKDIYDYQKYKGKHFVFNGEFFSDNYYENELVNDLLKKTFNCGHLDGNCINNWVTLSDKMIVIKRKVNYCLSEVIEDMEEYVKNKTDKEGD